MLDLLPAGQGSGMVGRHELSDALWNKIAPLLPANVRPGGQWADHRTVINGVLFQAFRMSLFPPMVAGAGLPHDPPPGPRLTWLLGGVAMRSGGEDAGGSMVGLWLGPLPPAARAHSRTSRPGY
ncbi:transposase [Thermoactinospora rubra]|uniref:transposase n=1 Tax=Thermoactinospora rubra TaxID=1088767 RepID=UPI00117FC947|nr:transposase [Thermoactinospora rubra]